jgi:hypothetical protein
MSGRTEYRIREVDKNKQPLHPAWTAVGCFLVAGFMVLGYFLAEWFLAANEKAYWILIPEEFAWPSIAPYLLFKLAVGLMVLTIGTAILSILYAIINPPKPGKYDIAHPEDLPPVYTKRK